MPLLLWWLNLCCMLCLMLLYFFLMACERRVKNEIDKKSEKNAEKALIREREGERRRKRTSYMVYCFYLLLFLCIFSFSSVYIELGLRVHWHDENEHWMSESELLNTAEKFYVFHFFSLCTYMLLPHKHKHNTYCYCYFYFYADDVLFYVRYAV